MNRSAVEYTHGMRDWLQKFKFKGDLRWVAIMVDMLDKAWETYQFPPMDAIAYTPASEQRLAERSFNQAALLAAALSKKRRTPCLDLLHKTSHTSKQSGKNRSDRILALSGTISLNQSVQLSRLKTIVLVDDVYTTGSTIHECAKKISESAEIEIYGLTWSRS